MPTSLQTISIIQAIQQVTENYFDVKSLGNEQTIHRERVYCYELYHQMRKMFGEESSLFLMGEVDKNGHAVIKERVIPDFIIHIPGTGSNLAIIEVKSISGLKDKKGYFIKKKIKCDLHKLFKFVSKYGYQKAYYLIYGQTSDKDKDKIKEKCNKIARELKFDSRKITILLHKKAGEQAVNLNW